MARAERLVRVEGGSSGERGWRWTGVEPEESDSSEEAVEPLSVSLAANVWDGTGDVARSGWSGLWSMTVLNLVG